MNTISYTPLLLVTSRWNTPQISRSVATEELVRYVWIAAAEAPEDSRAFGNEQLNPGQIKRIFSRGIEAFVMFFIHMLDCALQRTPGIV
jgi:hypothetical protein